MAIPKQQAAQQESTQESTEQPTEQEAAPVPALYNVRNITKNTLVLNGKPILPGEEGVATLAEVTTLVGYVEELGAV